MVRSGKSLKFSRNMANVNRELKKTSASMARQRASAGSSELSGVIFMCNSSTKNDCFKYGVFGLPEGKKDLVKQVRRGMHLFLFDIDLKLLYGIYKASSTGGLNLQPEAFRASKKAFPWQVKFLIHKDCIPLPEDAFKEAIKENYSSKQKFNIELTSRQVDKLEKLFRPFGAADVPQPPRKAQSSRYETPSRVRNVHDLLDGQGYLSSRKVPTNQYNTPSGVRGVQDRPELGIRSRGILPQRIEHDHSFIAGDLHLSHEAGFRSRSPHMYQDKPVTGLHGYIPTPLSLYGADSVIGSLPSLSTDAMVQDLEIRKSRPYLLPERESNGVGDVSAYQRMTYGLSGHSALQLPDSRDRTFDTTIYGLAHRLSRQLADGREGIFDRKIDGIDPLIDRYTGSSRDSLYREPEGIHMDDFGLMPRSGSSIQLPYATALNGFSQPQIRHYMGVDRW